jgi:hypothetical protein
MQALAGIVNFRVRISLSIDDDDDDDDIYHHDNDIIFI